MPRFRKKPVEIEARQHASATDYDKAEALREWIGTNAKWLHSPIGIVLEIHTREGVMRALPNDWIIKGVQGEFYPCKPDIFAATYEPVEHRPMAGKPLLWYLYWRRQFVWFYIWKWTIPLPRLHRRTIRRINYARWEYSDAVAWHSIRQKARRAIRSTGEDRRPT